MSLTRPVVSVFSAVKEDKEAKEVKSVPLPDVFTAPIRNDIVNRIHNFLSRRLRQPYARFEHAGAQTSAESWGTGRAVSRIPRVHGSGTHRAGQAAFGNMCRGGRMFAPLKVWRVWASKVSISQRRYAFASAIAASQHSAIVMSRGHRIERLRQVPLVVSNEIESYQNTKEAVELLKKVRAHDDVIRCKKGKNIRAGKGKMRNRKYRNKTGPLVIYKNNNGIAKAFRNISGVDVCCVNNLNLLKLAPGGKVGRFIIWTEAAFTELNKIFGSYDNKFQSEIKTRQGRFFKLPQVVMKNTDISSIINSDSIQNIIRPKQSKQSKSKKYPNPLKNYNMRRKLNPLAERIEKTKIMKEKYPKLFKEEQENAKKMEERENKATEKYKKDILNL